MAERRIYMTVSDMDRLGCMVLDMISNMPELEPLRALER